MIQRYQKCLNQLKIIMSVIYINISESVQALKCSYQDMNSMVLRRLSAYQMQQQKIVRYLTQRLMSEIIKRDKYIKALKEQKESSVSIISYLKDKENCAIEMRPENNNYSDSNEDIVRKYYELLRQNKQYEEQFSNLMEEMKMIKMYVQQLKRVRSLRNIQCQSSSVNENSPVKNLNFEEQDKLLTKISSLNRLQKIKINPYLDTIREVTQMSAHTEQDNDQQSRKQKQLFIETNSVAPFIQSHLSQSFECTSQMEDITNILFDNNSQQAKSSLQNSESNSLQFYESFQHSLSVLKNYGGNQNIEVSHVKSKSKNGIGFTLPVFDELICPQLIIKDIVNQRHIVFDEGFVYTGATVAIRDTLKPMGFGQLYFRNSLLYCGQWKDGVFDGWGKMFFPKAKRIKHFNGKWEQGIANGPCSIKFWNSDKFIGSLSKQEIRGQGTYFQQNKPIYSGYWQKNALLLQEEY